MLSATGSDVLAGRWLVAMRSAACRLLARALGLPGTAASEGTASGSWAHAAAREGLLNEARRGFGRGGGKRIGPGGAVVEVRKVSRGTLRVSSTGKTDATRASPAKGGKSCASNKAAGGLDVFRRCCLSSSRL